MKPLGIIRDGSCFLLFFFSSMGIENMMDGGKAVEDYVGVLGW